MMVAHSHHIQRSIIYLIMHRLLVNMFSVPQSQQDTSDSLFRLGVATRVSERACWSHTMPSAKRVLKTPIRPHRARKLRHASATLGIQAQTAVRAQSARPALTRNTRAAQCVMGVRPQAHHRPGALQSRRVSATGASSGRSLAKNAARASLRSTQ